MPTSNGEVIRNSWSPFKWLLTVIGIIIGGTGLYFTQYLWASARQTDKNTTKICAVESLAEENKEGLKDNAVEDRKTSDSVIEMKGDIKLVLKILEELRAKKK